MTTSFFDRVFGRSTVPDLPPANLRLTEGEALLLAKTAADRDSLLFNGYERVGDRVIWLFWSATMGSGVDVRVDDQSGEVDVKRWGVR